VQLEGVNPGDQSPEPTRMDLLLEPSDLVFQIAKVMNSVGRTRLVLSIGLLRIGFQGTARPVGQLADFPAQFGGARPGTFLARIVMRFLRLGVFHRWFIRCAHAVLGVPEWSPFLPRYIS
jgi:hypothetical protein